MSMPHPLLTLALGGFRYRKLRSALTALGIFIGIVVVVALIFLGQGLRRAVASQLRQFGSDLVFAIPRDVSDPFTSLLGRGEFRDEHLDAVRALPGAAQVMPTIESKAVAAEFGGENKTVFLHGQPWALISTIFEESQGFRIARGAWPEREGDREIVLGANFAEKGFSKPIDINDDIVIRGREYRVTGILEPLGEQNHDNSIFISIEMMRRVTGRHDGFSVMLVKVAAGYDLADVEKDVARVLEEQKNLDDFTVLTPDKAAAIASDVIGLIETVLFMVAAVAVAIGGIGIMNSMYTSVMERTREIGIMKSVGATNRRIITLFLLEAGIFGALGGASGVVGGALLAKIVESIARGYGYDFLQVSLDGVVIAAVLVFTFLIGVVSGVLPAREAARLNPAVSVRQR